MASNLITISFKYSDTAKKNIDLNIAEVKQDEKTLKKGPKKVSKGTTARPSYKKKTKRKSKCNFTSRISDITYLIL